MVSHIVLLSTGPSAFPLLYIRQKWPAKYAETGLQKKTVCSRNEATLFILQDASVHFGIEVQLLGGEPIARRGKSAVENEQNMFFLVNCCSPTAVPV